MHRKWSPKEKLEIVLEGLRDESGISAICRGRGISTTQFYNWKNQLTSSAETIFQRQNNKPNLKEEQLKQELARMKGVIAEISAENLDLKKGLGG
jgi:transposase-like protein